MMNKKLNTYMFIILMMLSMLMLSMNFMIYNYMIMLEWNILSVMSCNVYMTMNFDFMWTMFLSTVMFISSVGIMCSNMYMNNDKFINRFSYMVLGFVTSMIYMIISPNMSSIILGWDGVGLVSYCLVIYYLNLYSNNAGMLTALMNRIGDVAILMTISWMMNFGSWINLDIK